MEFQWGVRLKLREVYFTLNLKIYFSLRQRNGVRMEISVEAI
jgi:hypothetical protein